MTARISANPDSDHDPRLLKTRPNWAQTPINVHCSSSPNRQRALDLRALLPGDAEQLQPAAHLPGLLRPPLPRPLAHHLRSAKALAVVHRVHAALRHARRVSMKMKSYVKSRP